MHTYCSPNTQEPDVHDSGFTNGVKCVTRVGFKKCRVQSTSENSNVGDPGILTFNLLFNPINDSF